MIPSVSSKVAKRTGVAIGRFLSNFSYVLSTLLLHVLLSGITYLVLKIVLGSGKREAFIAYEIATGGDPFNFSDIFSPHPILWAWILMFHVISWLIVPVLAATAVDAAYRVWEEKRLEVDKRLQEQMRAVVERQIGVTGDAAIQIVLDQLEEMRKQLEKLKERE
jgi:hypothetical protein